MLPTLGGGKTVSLVKRLNYVVFRLISERVEEVNMCEAAVSLSSTLQVLSQVVGCNGSLNVMQRIQSKVRISAILGSEPVPDMH